MLRLKHVVVAVGLTLTVGAADLVPVAAASPRPAAGTATSYYVVQAGDYLAGIASKLGVSLNSLLTTNKLTTTSLIVPGMKLQVPTGGKLPAGSPAPAAASSSKPAASTYVVAAGDSLYGIASKLKVKLSDLLTLNRLTTSSVIVPGMKLQVPAGAAAPATTTTTAAPAASPLVYVVRSGDSLYGIASKVKVSFSSLLSVNKLTATSIIYPGMRLTVPAGGVVPTPTPSTTPATTSPATTTPATTPTSAGSKATPATGPISLPSVPTPSGVSPRVKAVLDFALAQIGDPYKFAAAGPDAWDCSGLTMAAYAEIGVSIPHYSGAQVNYGTVVDWTTAAIAPGDLVFLESSIGSGVISHVGIAISPTQWVQATRTGDYVRAGNIPMSRVVAVRRLVP